MVLFAVMHVVLKLFVIRFGNEFLYFNFDFVSQIAMLHQLHQPEML